MLCRPEPTLLYLGGGQLVAAFPLGSLWVAVDQHPLQLKLERNNNAIRPLCISFHTQWLPNSIYQSSPELSSSQDQVFLAPHVTETQLTRININMAGTACTESQRPSLSHHDRGVRVAVQPANQSVSLRVDGAFALDGLHVHGLAVHVKGDLVALHSDHHLVPPGVEEHGKARESDGLQVAVSVYQEVLEGLLVTVQPQPGLLAALLVHYLPDVPHLVHCVFDHAESHHEGVLIWKSTWKV